MAIKCADYSFARPAMTTLKNLGVNGVLRYVGDGNTGKDLTLAEAQELSNHGFYIFCNFEGSGKGGDFNQGVADARAADAAGRRCGASGNFVIYFSIDYDDQNPSNQDNYFKGINSVLGVARTDAYGSTGLIRHLKSAKLIRSGQAGWRTESTGWLGGAGSTSEFAFEQAPYNNDLDLDYCYTTLEQAGGWKVGTPASDPTPSGTLSEDEMYQKLVYDATNKQQHFVYLAGSTAYHRTFDEKSLKMSSPNPLPLIGNKALSPAAGLDAAIMLSGTQLHVFGEFANTSTGTGAHYYLSLPVDVTKSDAWGTGTI